jgi:hypothetical protein
MRFQNHDNQLSMPGDKGNDRAADRAFSALIRENHADDGRASKKYCQTLPQAPLDNYVQVAMGSQINRWLFDQAAGRSARWFPFHTDGKMSINTPVWEKVN